MSVHTSHDGKTIIDTKSDTITIEGRTFNIDVTDNDSFPLARTYTVDGLPGLTGKLLYEEDQSFCNPRENSENGSTLATFGHICRNYSIGDEQWDSSQRGDDFEAECQRCDGSGEDPERFELIRDKWLGKVVGAGTEEAMEGEAERSDDLFVRPAYCLTCKGEGNIRIDVIEYVKRYHDAIVATPVYIDSGEGANHGWARVDSPVDDATNAVLYSTKKDIESMQGKCDAAAIEQTKKNHVSEISEFSKYMEGECYFIRVIDQESGYEGTCGGYLGTEWTVEALFWDIAVAIEQRLSEIINRADAAARDIITV